MPRWTRLLVTSNQRKKYYNFSEPLTIEFVDRGLSAGVKRLRTLSADLLCLKRLLPGRRELHSRKARDESAETRHSMPRNPVVERRQVPEPFRWRARNTAIASSKVGDHRHDADHPVPRTPTSSKWVICHRGKVSPRDRPADALRLEAAAYTELTMHHRIVGDPERRVRGAHGDRRDVRLWRCSASGGATSRTPPPSGVSSTRNSIPGWTRRGERQDLLDIGPGCSGTFQFKVPETWIHHSFSSHFNSFSSAGIVSIR
jgi:hypothetical protein